MMMMMMTMIMMMMTPGNDHVAAASGLRPQPDGSYRWELAGLVMMAVYAVVYLYGRAENEKIKNAWSVYTSCSVLAYDCCTLYRAGSCRNTCGVRRGVHLRSRREREDQERMVGGASHTVLVCLTG
jgi:hypothetical protein